MDDAEPLRIRLPAGAGLDKDSDLLFDQVRAIDNKRLLDGPLLQLDDAQLREIYRAVGEVLEIAVTV